MYRVPLLACLSVIAFLSQSASASPSGNNNLLHARQNADNVVYVTDAETFWDAHTDIGDSEHPGGMKTYCSPNGKFSSAQGETPCSRGARFAQLTGCIRPELVDRLNTNDGGGQYDSSGGANGQGNPEGSVCLGYNHYVELVEPAANRACIKCCDNFDDCPVDKGNLFLKHATLTVTPGGIRNLKTIKTPRIERVPTSSDTEMTTSKQSFRRHREVTNAAQVIGFLSQWQAYLNQMPKGAGGEEFRGKKLDPIMYEKMSTEQLGQLYELKNATKEVWKSPQDPKDSEGSSS
ncbi:hypothetical protein K435DRAFT_963722 [Dendrothele bispora CBS 962.96]|uniref:Succinate dehydrogenase assembly factor 3 n=1 Tax=Dendrothele bispora (strain CBS 962.96) TaxID=1314807 RepID=A0A4S8MF31_DENBC|nr:hypothetical protein K435DRAFT_963722 [Dendrothele bispora CBS 962.96]